MIRLRLAKSALLVALLAAYGCGGGGAKADASDTLDDNQDEMEAGDDGGDADASDGLPDSPVDSLPDDEADDWSEDPDVPSDADVPTDHDGTDPDLPEGSDTTTDDAGIDDLPLDEAGTDADAPLDTSDTGDSGEVDPAPDGDDDLDAVEQDTSEDLWDAYEITDAEFLDSSGGTGELSGVVSRSSGVAVDGASGTDGRGGLLIGLWQCDPFVPGGCAVVDVIPPTGEADLSDPSYEVPYEFTGLSSGWYWVVAILDDDGSGFAPEPWDFPPASGGDMASWPAESFYVFTSGTTAGADVALTVRASSVHGTVTVDGGLPYSGDGIGTLYLLVTDSDPSLGGPFSFLGAQLLRSADILDAAPEPFSLGLLSPPGTAWIVAFLDDDVSGSSPNSGEPASIPATQIVVSVPGDAHAVDLVLSMLLP